MSLFQKGTCSLSNNNESNTCYDLSMLQEIGKKLNQLYNLSIPISDNIEILYNNISSALSDKDELINSCKDESCLLDIADTKSYYSKYFAPIAPENWKTDKTTMLNTLHIKQVGEQIQTKYPKFKFLGVTPIDFSNKVNGKYIHDLITNVNISKLKQQGYDYFGMVFNTDPHYKGGEHWICLFVNIKTKTLYYYDSYAESPEQEVLDYMLLLYNQFGNGVKLLYNQTIHQKKGNECGMYCLYFLLKMVENNSNYEETIKNMPNDDDINLKRGDFFNLIG